MSLENPMEMESPLLALRPVRRNFGSVGANVCVDTHLMRMGAK